MRAAAIVGIELIRINQREGLRMSSTNSPSRSTCRVSRLASDAIAGTRAAGAAPTPSPAQTAAASVVRDAPCAAGPSDGTIRLLNLRNDHFMRATMSDPSKVYHLFRKIRQSRAQIREGAGFSEETGASGGAGIAGCRESVSGG